MDALKTRRPAWVSAILGWRPLVPMARTALVSAYLFGSLTKLLNYRAAIAELDHFGLRPGWLWAALAIAVELGGSVCVIADRLAWLGAGGLGCLTAVAMLVANDFWNMAGAARLRAANSFFEHLGLIAALLMAVWLSDSIRRDGKRHLHEKP